MTRWRTFTDEGRARSIMRHRNRDSERFGTNETTVLIEGPCDGEVTLAPLAEAIDAGFCYCWEVAS